MDIFRVIRCGAVEIPKQIFCHAGQVLRGLPGHDLGEYSKCRVVFLMTCLGGSSSYKRLLTRVKMFIPA